MTNNELIKELVVYDGYKDIGYDTYTNGKNSGFLMTIPELYPYLTDMNIIHRLAVKVVDDLIKLYMDDDTHHLAFEHDMKVTEVKSSVVSAMFTSPNEQGEHLQLATALVNAIRYISANKAG